MMKILSSKYVKLFFYFLLVPISFGIGHYVAGKQKDHEAAVKASLNLSTHVRLREAHLSGDSSKLLERLDVAMFEDLVLMDLLDTRSPQVRPEGEQHQRVRSAAMASKAWITHPSKLESESKIIADQIITAICNEELTKKCGS